MLQAPLLAHLLQRPVVHDFRAADLALGGTGSTARASGRCGTAGTHAGLAGTAEPGRHCQPHPHPPCSGVDRHAAILGWDCGPANSLIDLGMRQFTNGAQSFDKGGAMAAQGHADEGWIQRWLQEEYFQLAPPKSTGRECFGQDDLNRRLHQLGGASAADAIATLTAFSAAVVAQDLARLRQSVGIAPIELITAGGGSQNPVLIDELRRRCRGAQLDESSSLGVPTEAREALVFALLAWWHYRGHPGNVPAVTGASRETVLGTRVEPALTGPMQAQAPGSAPQTAGLLRFQGRPQALLAGRRRCGRLQLLLMALNPLLDQHPRHVAHRAGFQLRHRRETRAEILRQNHLNSRGLGLPAG